MHSLMLNNRTGRTLMGGLQEKLIDYDVSTSKQFSVLNDVADGTNAILRDHSRFVVSGDVPSGRVHLRDPLTLKVTDRSSFFYELGMKSHTMPSSGNHYQT